MSLFVLYDDSTAVSDEIVIGAGVRRFSRILYRKKSLLAWFEQSLVRLRDAQVIHLASSGIVGRTRRPSRGEFQRATVLIVPSFLGLGSDVAASADFLAKLSLTRNSVCVNRGSAPANRRPADTIVVLVGEQAVDLLDYVFENESLQGYLDSSSGPLALVPDDVGLIDLRDPTQFAEHISSNFDARHFNSLRSEERFTVVKRSSDKEKLRREYRYFDFLPPEMHRFFVRPFQFEESSESASYRMERMFVPDVAVQWIHGSIEEGAFERLLEHLFHYLEQRPSRPASMEQVRDARDAMYLTKLRERMQDFRLQHPAAKIERLLCEAGADTQTLMERYERLYSRLAAATSESSLALSHGDLCFSNILYGRESRVVRFIDPRGADDLEGMYLHPYYDLAKLSHSVLGSYDFINAELFDLVLDEKLQPSLQLSVQPPAFAGPLFSHYVEAHGFNLRLVRIYETSLFLSMVPLHIDSPRKVCAFLLNAMNILDQIETADKRAIG